MEFLGDFQLNTTSWGAGGEPFIFGHFKIAAISKRRTAGLHWRFQQIQVSLANSRSFRYVSSTGFCRERPETADPSPRIMKIVAPFLLPLIFCLLAPHVRAADKPNILLLTSEDHGPEMGCYGDAVARTPNVDALAARGMLFKKAWSCGPVCAAARTTLIMGMYPQALAAEHMRSNVPMPDGLKMYPQYLKEAGYFCPPIGKEDFNVTKPRNLWDDAGDKEKGEGPGVAALKTRTPFFAVFNATVSHESQIRKRPHQAVVDPLRVRVPKYHPDTPEVRQDWAQYYDQVSAADAAAGKHLAQLAEAGLEEDTIIFYFGDHGSGMPRSKRWPSNSGLHVPFVVYFPEKWKHLAPKEYAAGGKSDRLISFVDVAPTLLSLAGIEPPKTMHGHAFAGKFQTEPQPFIHGFKGRMDERIDLVRSVTDGRYVYIRNYMPHRSQAQHVAYQFETPTTRIWKRMFDEGKLNEAQSLFWKMPKAPEELYDLEVDRDEVDNLAGSAVHQEILVKLRKAQQDLAVKIRDTGFLTEAEVHTRAGAKAPRDVLAADAAYPFARVFAAADLASLMKAESLPALQGYLRDADSGVRYWGAMGALMQGAAGVKALKADLLKALKDASPSVRIAAAEALAREGEPGEAKQALETLLAAADVVKTGTYASISALNAIDELGKKGAPAWDAVESMVVKDPQVTERANGYVARLQKTIIEKAKPDVAPQK